LAAAIKGSNRSKDSSSSGDFLSQNHTLLLLEHSPVFTVGIRDKEYSEDEEKRLRKLGADFYRADRGGLITFHGPGQLVAYPVMDLSAFAPPSTRRKTLLGVKWYSVRSNVTYMEYYLNEMRLHLLYIPSIHYIA